MTMTMASNNLILKTLVSNTAKFSTSIRHVSRTVTPPGSILSQYSSVEAISKSRIASETVLKQELWNGIFGEKHFSGDIRHAAMKFTMLPIKTFDFKGNIKMNGIQSAIYSLDVNTEAETLSDYNKITPKCNPSCTPGSSSTQKGSKKGSGSPYPCPSKKQDSNKTYPGCSPGGSPRCKPKKCMRNLSTLSRHFYAAKDITRAEESPDPSQDPQCPSRNPYNPQNNPSNPQQNPNCPQQNPYQNPSQDPNNPDRSNPSRRDDDN